MRMCLSTALHMSYTVNRATLTAVRASISTPVRPVHETSLVAVTPVLGQLQRHGHVVQDERMAKRNQFAGAFGRLDPGNLGDRQHVALGDLVVADQIRACRRPVRSCRWPGPCGVAAPCGRRRPCGRGLRHPRAIVLPSQPPMRFMARSVQAEPACGLAGLPGSGPRPPPTARTRKDKSESRQGRIDPSLASRKRLQRGQSPPRPPLTAANRPFRQMRSGG